MLLQKFEFRSLPTKAASGLLFFVKFVGLFEACFEEFIFQSVPLDTIFERHKHFKVIDHLDDKWELGCFFFLIFFFFPILSFPFLIFVSFGVLISVFVLLIIFSIFFLVLCFSLVCVSVLELCKSKLFLRFFLNVVQSALFVVSSFGDNWEQVLNLFDGFFRGQFCVYARNHQRVSPNGVFRNRQFVLILVLLFLG